MSSSNPRSWTSSLLGFAFAVVAVCVALNLAADLLLQALPILLLAIGVGVLGLVAWRAYSRRGGW